MISSFTGDYRFLSNFYMCPITVFGFEYSSAEHAYQASKTVSETDHDMIATLKLPGDAKKAGSHVKLRPDWGSAKVPIMEKIVFEKFHQNPELMGKLQATRGLKLIEGNTWGDTFWGECPLGTGKNMLGKILMGIRDDISLFFAD